MVERPAVQSLHTIWRIHVHTKIEQQVTLLLSKKDERNLREWLFPYLVTNATFAHTIIVSKHLSFIILMTQENHLEFLKMVLPVHGTNLSEKLKNVF